MQFIRRDVLVGAAGALVAVVLLGAGTLVLRNDGIEFPDGSVQQTADAVLVDSVGNVVGPIIGYSAKFRGDTTTPISRPLVLFRHDGYPIALKVEQNHLHVPGLIFCNPKCDQSLSGVAWVRKVFYLLADCAGPAYIYSGGWRAGNGFDQWMDFHYALGFENRLYRASILTWEGQVPFQSWGLPEGCTNASGTLLLAHSLEDTGLDLDDLFTPPFHNGFVVE